MMSTVISPRTAAHSFIGGIPTSTGLLADILPLGTTKPHEQVYPVHACQLGDDIVACGHFTTPILVDSRNHILLDGHNQPWVLSKRIRARFIPAILSDYDKDSLISVTSWRDGIVVDGSLVRDAALSGRLLECKMSRHRFKIGLIRTALTGLNKGLLYYTDERRREI
ncbi:hypothetical protein [Mesorhizobium escarrei]|uniref:Hedgehog/Intein (Hint) domain-containing protein n=1 Tax=Mesorhizobium escarrei TaxID=666018 RepID=A0ABN8JZE8_9HYPH|nr:hypothetical protein MES5069_310072 [Mesorhizobium escarrei]